MSRCYPYPPPGYERRANVELGLSPKKERHKRKDKKKKRRKDSESNGGLPLALSDFDKRAKKTQQSGVSKGFGSANGSLPGTLATPSKTVHEAAAQRVQAVISNVEMPSAATLASNGKGFQPSSRQGSLLSSASIKTVCKSNGAVGADETPSPSTYGKAVNESHTQYIPPRAEVWPILDDEDWLFLEDKLLQSQPRNPIPSPQVWAEALSLPSVGIYALPYVVPD